MLIATVSFLLGTTHLAPTKLSMLELPLQLASTFQRPQPTQHLSLLLKRLLPAISQEVLVLRPQLCPLLFLMEVLCPQFQISLLWLVTQLTLMFYLLDPLTLLLGPLF